jgi:hypothetical protein
MDHKESVAKKMAESYLLDELTPDDRDAFEEHYFSCPECAKDVKAGAMLVANLKEVLDVEPALQVVSAPARTRPGWFARLQPAYAMAAALALAVVLYQNVVTIPKLQEQASSNVPQALSGFMVRAQSRGPETANVQVEPKQPFVLYIDIPPSDNFASYTFEVQSEDGARQFSTPVPAEAAKEAVQLYVSGGLLKPGKYVVVLRGHRKTDGGTQTDTEIQRYPFSLEYKK